MSNVELRVVSAALRSREAYTILKEHAELEMPAMQLLFGLAGEWYDNDHQAAQVDQEIFEDQIRGKFPTEAKAEHVLDICKEAFALSFSIPNYISLSIESKRAATGNRLAAALSNSDRDDSRIDTLLEQYASLKEADKLDNDDEVLHNITVEDSLNTVLSKEGRIYLAPRTLNEETGGAMPGHHIVIFARPEVGKTAETCTLMAGFAWHNLPGIFFGNEEPVLITAARVQSCMTGMTAEEMGAEPDKATALLARRGWENIRFIPITPGTPAEIERYVKRYGAKWFIVDQLRHLAVKADTRTNQLEAAANAVRQIGLRNGALSISVTQAGDSGEGKLRLTQGDIDSSNTGIPGSADLMIGIGMNDEFESQGMRMFNLPKNKLSGRHSHFPVKIDVSRSKMEAI